MREKWLTRFKKETPNADPSRMRDDDQKGPRTDLFGLVVEDLRTPSPLGTKDEQRRMLLAELSGLIERGEYEVAPEAVAEAIIDESGRFELIDWRD